MDNRKKDGTLDVESILENMEDYSSDNDDILKSFMDGGISDDRPAEEDEDLNLDKNDNMDLDSFDNDLDNTEHEQEASDYLKNFEIEDKDLQEVELEDFGIQEDIIIDDIRHRFPFKMVFIGIICSILCFATIIIVMFFNKYTMVPQNVKHNIWTNESYSFVPKDYELTLADIQYGQTVMYIENSGDFIKTYKYATIIDTKLKTPRAIKCFDNESGETITISIEKIRYIVDTDINEGLVIPNDNTKIDVILDNGEINAGASESIQDNTDSITE